MKTPNTQYPNEHPVANQLDRKPLLSSPGLSGLRFGASVVVGVWCLGLLPAFAQGTAFTYQGRLNNGNNPANGSYDLTFTLFSVSSGGSALAGPLTNSATTVSNGLFTTLVDFGPGVFTGTSNWLEIAVRTNGTGGFTTLAPRQQLTPTPYAITAENVVSGGLAAGTYGSAVTLSNANNAFAGSFSGNGASVTNVNAATLNGLGAGSFWQLGGNTGTTPGAQFLGTTDNKALTLKVNNLTALQIVPGTTLPNVVGGLAAVHPSVLAGGVSGAVIAGGNAPSGAVNGFGGGDFEAVYDNDGTVGGGFGNKVGSNDGDLTDAAFATVAGGVFNSATNYAATVAGGDGNLAGGQRAMVGGGFGNAATADFSFIGGGQLNVIRNATNSIIGGGSANFVGPNGRNAVIGGGSQNTNSGAYAVIGGGWSNSATGYGSFIGGGGSDGIDAGNLASGDHSSVVGGAANTAGNTGASVGGGGGNTASGIYTTIGGGLANSASLDMATVSGGYGNAASGIGAFVGGGGIDAADGYSGNTASGAFATVTGGTGNTANETWDTVGGGAANTAGGLASTIPGGFGNTASGFFSLAAGYQAQALHYGTFVWADYSPSGFFSSTASNQFLIRAGGGVGIGTNNPTDAALSVMGRVRLNDSSIFFRSGTDTNHGVGWYGTGKTFAGFAPDGPALFGWAGGALGTAQYGQQIALVWNSSGRVGIGTTSPSTLLQVGSATCNGTTWANGSDRNAKENFKPVDARSILKKVTALPVSRWNYKEDTASEHIGPMAQDFYAAFNVGPDDKHIATVDADGVALAAIQGLNEKVEVGSQKAEARIRELEVNLGQKETEMAELREQNGSLEKRLEALEKMLLAQKSN